MTPTLVTGTNGAAKILGCSGTLVHSLVDRGELPCTRTETGRRVFLVAHVERLAIDRVRARVQKAAVVPA